MRAKEIPILVSLALIGTLGAVHGVLTNRWANSGQLQDAIDAISRVPAQIGVWNGEDLPTDGGDLARMGIKGSLLRRFQNQESREFISLLLVCGQGGPISVHTPDVCYASAGFEEVSKEVRQEIECNDGQKASFIVARFGKTTGVYPVQLEISWAWSLNGIEWLAPENPRASLARATALYKLYVVREFVPGSPSEAADTSRSFLRSALPAIRQSLKRSGP